MNTNTPTSVSPDSIEWSNPSNQPKLYPHPEWEGRFGWYPKAKSIDHPFLQQLIDIQAVVTIEMGEWMVIGYESMALLYVYKDFITLECLATPPEYRRKGSAVKLMKALVSISDETGIPIRIRATEVTGPGKGWMLPIHPVIAIGMQKQRRIPVDKLVLWYERRGFVSLSKIKRHNGVHMEYKPKQIDNGKKQEGPTGDTSIPS